jgi:hypothetical protein
MIMRIRREKVPAAWADAQLAYLPATGLGEHWHNQG